jgi:hypothetical protein
MAKSTTSEQDEPANQDSSRRRDIQRAYKKRVRNKTRTLLGTLPYWPLNPPALFPAAVCMPLKTDVRLDTCMQFSEQLGDLVPRREGSDETGAKRGLSSSAAASHRRVHEIIQDSIGTACPPAKKTDFFSDIHHRHVTMRKEQILACIVANHVRFDLFFFTRGRFGRPMTHAFFCHRGRAS